MAYKYLICGHYPSHPCYKGTMGTTNGPLLYGLFTKFNISPSGVPKVQLNTNHLAPIH